MYLLVAVALAASSPDTSVDKVCGHALASLVAGDAEINNERYVGRMEIRMRELNFEESEKPVVRLMCDVYLKGAVKGLEMLGDRFRELDAQSK